MTSREVPMQARPPRECINLKSKSELCFPVWSIYRPNLEEIRKMPRQNPSRK